MSRDEAEFEEYYCNTSEEVDDVSPCARLVSYNSSSSCRAG